MEIGYFVVKIATLTFDAFAMFEFSIWTRTAWPEYISFWYSNIRVLNLSLLFLVFYFAHFANFWFFRFTHCNITSNSRSRNPYSTNRRRHIYCILLCAAIYISVACHFKCTYVIRYWTWHSGSAFLWGTFRANFVQLCEVVLEIWLEIVKLTRNRTCDVVADYVFAKNVLLTHEYNVKCTLYLCSLFTIISHVNGAHTMWSVRFFAVFVENFAIKYLFNICKCETTLFVAFLINTRQCIRSVRNLNFFYQVKQSNCWRVSCCCCLI